MYYFVYPLTYMYQACYMPDIMLGVRDAVLSKAGMIRI